MTQLFIKTESNGAFTFTPVDTPAPEPFWVSWPVEAVEAPRITDPFNAPRDYANRKHEGIDCDAYINAAERSARILAAQDGIVEYAVSRSDNPSYGKHVVIVHPWGDDPGRYRTLYAHLSSITVKVGDVVSNGHVIGIAGNSGTAAIHLHFGVYDTVDGLLGYVRCKDCSGIRPGGVIDPVSVLRAG